MKRIGIFLLSSLAVLGCQQDGDVPLRKEITALKDGQAKIQADQAKILAALKSGAGRAGANRPRPPARPRPNPASVYSIDLGNSPFRGAKNAKVTIVEAFEFS